MNRHLGERLQHRSQVAFKVRRQVHDNDKRRAAVGGDGGEEALQGRHAARRSAQRHHREQGLRLRFRRLPILPNRTVGAGILLLHKVLLVFLSLRIIIAENRLDAAAYFAAGVFTVCSIRRPA